MTAPKATSAKKPIRGKRINRICTDAKRLGVSRVHLWAVLRGRRNSPELIAKYCTLIASEINPKNPQP
jgi:hypothetical protein